MHNDSDKRSVSREQLSTLGFYTLWPMGDPLWYFDHADQGLLSIAPQADMRFNGL